MIFPFVREGRLKSARLAYDFYRSEHMRIYGFDDPTPFSDDGYRFDWFVRDMAPLKPLITKPKTDDSFDKSVAIQAVQRGASRATENGGRQAMIHAVDKVKEEPEPDPPQSTKEKVEEALKPEKKPKIRDYKGNVVKMKPKKVKGWARVPTGAETCGWCLMLCSRGPVYTSAYTAGLELEDYQAVRDYNAGQEVDRDDMNQWHPGCDCKVVPVMDLQNWPGKEQADENLKLWNEAMRLAEEELKRNPDKKSLVNGRWVKTTLNREAINQMRRLVGEYDKKSTRLVA